MSENYRVNREEYNPITELELKKFLDEAMDYDIKDIPEDILFELAKHAAWILDKKGAFTEEDILTKVSEMIVCHSLSYLQEKDLVDVFWDENGEQYFQLKQ